MTMERSIATAVLVLASLASVPALAGGGGHHHHHGHSSFSFGLSLGPTWYPYYRPVYVAPPPVTYVYPQPSVQYVVPPTTYVAPAVAAPAPAPAAANWTSRGEPKANILPASQSVNATVTIRNPANSGGSVAFLVDDSSEVTLTAGRTQTLTNKSSYTIEFDRGGDFGTARKTLTGGAYEFAVTESGWDLVETGRVASKPSVRKNALPDSTLR
jgi:hypothetical protein